MIPTRNHCRLHLHPLFLLLNSNHLHILLVISFRGRDLMLKLRFPLTLNPLKRNNGIQHHFHLRHLLTFQNEQLHHVQSHVLKPANLLSLGPSFAPTLLLTLLTHMPSSAMHTSINPWQRRPERTRTLTPSHGTKQWRILTETSSSPRRN